MAKTHKTSKQGIYCYNSELAGTTELNLKSSPFKATKVITRHQSSQFSDKLLCGKGIKCILKKLAEALVVMATDVHNITPLLIKITTKQGEKCLIRYIQSFYLVMILIDSVISYN